ncbi:MAG: toll/interleukin-1 receptor domain-containing protein [Synechococcus sp.]
MGLNQRSKSRIFINYRRDDARGIAGRLEDSLSAYFGDDRVFRDVNDIEAGADFETVLQDTVLAADALIVLIGPDWLDMCDGEGRRRLNNADDWVAREVVTAMDKQVPIFPVLVEDTPMPRAADLPDALKPLANRNAISISDKRWATDVARLAKFVALDIPGSAAERTLGWVNILISCALFATTAFTPPQPPTDQSSDSGLTYVESTVTYFAIAGSTILLFVIALLVDPAKRRLVYASALCGALGMGISFISLTLVDEDRNEPVSLFVGSTLTVTGMFALMNQSGFKPK